MIESDTNIQTRKIFMMNARDWKNGNEIYWVLSEFEVAQTDNNLFDDKWKKYGEENDQLANWKPIYHTAK